MPTREGLQTPTRASAAAHVEIRHRNKTPNAEHVAHLPKSTKGDNDVSSKPIWVLPGGARFPADACKAVCRECDGPLHDPWESRGVSFGCDTCC